MTIAAIYAQQPTSQLRFEPALYTRSDTYLPFFLDTNYMAHRRTREIGWERKEDQKYLNLLRTSKTGLKALTQKRRSRGRRRSPNNPFRNSNARNPAFRLSQPGAPFGGTVTYAGIRGYERCRGCQGIFNGAFEHREHLEERTDDLRHWTNNDSALFDIRTNFTGHDSDQQCLLDVEDIPNNYCYTDSHPRGFAPDFEEGKENPLDLTEVVRVDHSDFHEFHEFKAYYGGAPHNGRGEEYNGHFSSDEDEYEDYLLEGEYGDRVYFSPMGRV